jgi:pilus assembly protein CpaC
MKAHLLRGSKTMSRITTIIAAVFAVVAVALTAPAAHAADRARTFAEVSGQVIHLPLNKSMVIDLDGDVRDVMVSNPAIADAVVRSNRRVFIIGTGVGETNVFLFGDGGRELGEFELVVSRDVAGLQQMFDEVIPGSRIQARTIGDSLVLTGTAPTAETAAKATDLAAKFIGDPRKIVNMLSVAGTDQVHLKVVVAEVQREVIQDLGIDTKQLLENAGVAVQIVNGDTSKALTYGSSLSNMVKLLGERTLIRTLAEPTLTAISGEKAHFLAGGEYPVPVPDGTGKITIEFKKFGIQLDFRPVVLTPGRISLQIATEVSELTDAGAVELAGMRIPALSVRRAESTVELPSGGSVVMAGLIRDNVRQTISGYPGLMDVPVLGALFKSRQFQRNQTELVVFVSPYLVDPVATSAITRPDKNLTFAQDSKAIFLGHVNKVFTGDTAAPSAPYHGRVGFAFE